MIGFRFTSASLFLLWGLMISGCGTRIEFPVPSRSSSTNLILVGDLYRPNLAGRLPVVIFLAPCGGVTQHMHEWAKRLKALGYIAVIIDSFSPRGSINACRGENPQILEVTRDALAALRHLTTLPFVDIERVALMGWSHGGGAALGLGLLNTFDHNDFEKQISFRAVVAFYPPCEFLNPNTEIPTLLLLAGRDDWSPPGQCLDNGGKTVIRWQIYPEAYHGFDQPGSTTTYLGHMMAHDALATNASRNEVEKFLEKELKR